MSAYYGENKIKAIRKGAQRAIAIYKGNRLIFQEKMAITANCQHVTLEGLSENVLFDDPLVVNITTDEGCALISVQVEMYGVDITGEVYANNTIAIPEVKGEVIITAMASPIIVFEDAAVKNICVENWGGGVIEGEITEYEASLVTTLDSKFYNNTTIVKFNEFRYFTGITSLYRSDSNGAVGQFYHCDNLEEITMPAANITNLGGAFRRAFSTAAKAVTVDLRPITTPSSKSIAFSGVFREAYIVVKVILPGFKSGSSWQYAFRGDTALEEIEIDGTLDLSAVTSYLNAFYSCTKLSTITGIISGISANIDLSPCPLTRDSALVILNGLATISGNTLKLKESTTALLSADDIAIGTNKGWAITV